MAEAFVALAQAAQKRIKEISVAELKGRIGASSNTIVIDVREREELVSGAIPGAYYISRGVIEASIERVVPDKNTCIVLYCSGGYRSALAADNLQLMGYDNVYSLSGGYVEWKKLT